MREGKRRKGTDIVKERRAFDVVLLSKIFNVISIVHHFAISSFVFVISNILETNTTKLDGPATLHARWVVSTSAKLAMRGNERAQEMEREKKIEKLQTPKKNVARKSN